MKAHSENTVRGMEILLEKLKDLAQGEEGTHQCITLSRIALTSKNIPHFTLVPHSAFLFALYFSK